MTGVDPGCGELFVGVTANNGVKGNGKDGGDGFRYILHQRQHWGACGFTAFKRWQEGRAKRLGFKWVETNVLARAGSKYTGSLDSFNAYVDAALSYLIPGKVCYASVQARQGRLRVHMLQQKQMHRVAQCLAVGFTGVKGKWSKFDGHWRSGFGGGRSSSSFKLPPVAIVALGNASAGWGSSLSRNGSAPVASLTDFLRREYSTAGVTVRGLHLPAGGRCSMHLISVDEFRSSQTCSRCFQLKLQNARIGGVKQHKVLYCEQGVLPAEAIHPAGSRQPEQCHDACAGGRLYVNRDVNAARNLTALALFMLFARWCIDQQHWDDAARISLGRLQ